jgi:hypothetical protein
MPVLLQPALPVLLPYILFPIDYAKPPLFVYCRESASTVEFLRTVC